MVLHMKTVSVVDVILVVELIGCWIVISRYSFKITSFSHYGDTMNLYEFSFLLIFQFHSYHSSITLLLCLYQWMVFYLYIILVFLLFLYPLFVLFLPNSLILLKVPFPYLVYPLMVCYTNSQHISWVISSPLDLGII